MLYDYILTQQGTKHHCNNTKEHKKTQTNIVRDKAVLYFMKKHYNVTKQHYIITNLHSKARKALSRHKIT